MKEGKIVEGCIIKLGSFYIVALVICQHFLFTMVHI